MKCVEVTKFSDDYSGLVYKDMDMPPLSKGKVLIKMICAPVNPIDMMTLAGTYPLLPPLPFLAGTIAVGEVVGSKAGLFGAFLKGKRVAFATPNGAGGAWAEYVATEPDLCVPLPGKLANKDAVNLISNALTTIGLLSTLKEGGHKSAIFTAAYSEVGQMLNMEAERAGITFINVVRNDDHIPLLKKCGATYCLNMKSKCFETELRQLTAQLNCRAAIDSISGSMPERLMANMPNGATVWTIGRLSGQPASFDAMEHLIAQQHTMKGFSVYEWMNAKSKLGKIRAVFAARDFLIRHDYKTKVSLELSLEEAATSLFENTQKANGGKILIYPSGGQ